MARLLRGDTPGVEALDNTSTALGLKSEPQPDTMLRIVSECAGRTQAERRFVRGVPELLVEVSHTSRYTDLGPKFEDYERVGVLEYVVRAIEPDEVYWFVLQRALVDLEPRRTGSTARRISPACGSIRWRFWRATGGGFAPSSTSAAPPEHTAFVNRLAEVRGGA